MAQPTRRRFLLAGLTASAAFVPGWGRTASSQGLDQFASGPAPCKADEQPTPAAPEGTDFRAGSPERSSLRGAGVTGTPLVVTGTLSGLTCGPIKHALLDFWQADSTGAFDKTGFRLRGHQFSDASGRYRLETVVPGPHDSHAPCLHVKVQPQGKAAFTTQLFFPDDPRTKSDPQFKPELVMKVTGGPTGKSAVFDIVLNL